MGFYVESADRPFTSRLVAEDIRTGELGADNGSQEAVPFDFETHAEEDLLGVATQPRRGDYVAEEMDETTDFVYEASEEDRASFGGDADRDVIKVRTAEDPDGNESAPSISEGDVVGVVDTSAGSLSSTDEYAGRVVEEGYEDGEDSATTYERDEDNFFAIGVAHRDEASDYDEPVRIQVRKDLN